jgi:hypothetical protein
MPEPEDPQSAWTKAATIGASKVGERYVDPTNPGVLDIVRQMLGMGAARPRSVQAADPYGIEAWLKGAGPMPILAATTEPGPPIQPELLEKIAAKYPRFVKALQSVYTAPTAEGKVAQPFYSRLDEAVAGLPKQTFGPRVLGVVQKGLASAEELAARDVPAFVKAAGNKPIPKAALEAHLAEHPVPQVGVITRGAGAVEATPRALPDGYQVQALAPSRGRIGPQRNYTLVTPDGSGHAFYATDAADAHVMARDLADGIIDQQMAHDRHVLEEHGFEAQRERLGLEVDEPAGDMYLVDDIGHTLTSDDMEALPQPAAIAWNRLMRNSEDVDLRVSKLAPKYDSYQVPGGDNYRETLLTLGDQTPPPDLDELLNKRAALDEQLQMAHDEWQRAHPGQPTGRVSDFAPDVSREYDRLQSQIDARQMGQAGGYKGPHWDEPNVLVHTRSHERELPGLGRGTYLEELQSDWHQAGKQHGYLPTAAEKVQLQADLKAAEQAHTPFSDARHEALQAMKDAGRDSPQWAELSAKFQDAEAAMNDSWTHVEDARRALAGGQLQLAPGYRLDRLNAEDARALGARPGDWQVIDPQGEDFGPHIEADNEQMALQRFRAGADDAGAGDVVRRAMTGGQVPDAPFKDTWPDLALKHHLVEAAQDPKTEWLGFSSGDTQAKRWGSERVTWQKVDAINLRDYSDANVRFTRAWENPRDGRWYAATEANDAHGLPRHTDGAGYASKAGAQQVIDRQPKLELGGFLVKFEPQVAGNALGGDMGADALRAGHIRNDSKIVSSLEDLEKLFHGSEVQAQKAWKRMQAAPDGGTYLPRKEGMESFYDEQLPNKLRKIVKPYGGTVERTPLARHTDDIYDDIQAIHDANRAAGSPEDRAAGARLNALREEHSAAEKDTHAWVIKMTPELRKKILQSGLPLMTGIGAVGLTRDSQP